ncbi:MAG: signal peptidase I [Phycisphaerae bacterium]|nr:signal peptidase I [Phycisphaerae bacterium]
MQENQNRTKGGSSTGVVTEIASTIESLIIALILALVFMEFVLQAFRIPTGSMAHTLRGDHFQFICRQCGFRYDYGYEFAGMDLPNTVETRCPNCDFYQNVTPHARVAGGDRILVMKFIYQFFEPKRWDVVVFKEPANPKTNFIKRLIGKPGEKIQIVDGDIYINGLIARKPAKVQQELWMPIYNNDYQPVNPDDGRFDGGRWRQPFVNRQESNWRTDEQGPTVFILETESDKFNFLEYNPSSSTDLRAAYAYNNVDDYIKQPYCSDLKISFWFDFSDSAVIGAELSKYDILYRGFMKNSKLIIERIKEGASEILAEKDTHALPGEKVIPFSFENADHRLVLRVGGDGIFADLGSGMDDAGPIKPVIPPTAAIFAAGTVKVSHLAIFRDIHYTEAPLFSNDEKDRATRENPFVLDKNQYFMLGDNSPGSADSRLWDSFGIGNSGKQYPKGIVPAEYLMGKALFVYWPAGFRPFEKFQFGFVPNIAEMKFIYGGSDRK